MTRSLFFFTALAAMLMTMSAVLIRVELAYPGVSALFSDAGGAPDGPRFLVTSVFHNLMAYFAAMLLGTTMISAARDKGALGSTLMLGVGVLLCVALASALVLSALILNGLAPDPRGWLATSPWFIDQRFDPTVFQLCCIRPKGASSLVPMLVFPATAMLYLGAYAMVSTLRGFRPIGLFGIIATLAMLTLTGAEMTQRFGATDMPVMVVFALLPLLACAAVHLIDHATPWVMALFVVILVPVFAVVLVEALYEFSIRETTLVGVARDYIFPLGFAWLALPMLMIYRFGTSLTAAHIVIGSAVIVLSLGLWIDPMIRVGLKGMPPAYVYYTDNYAPENLSITIGVGLFMLIYLAILIILRRTRLHD